MTGSPFTRVAPALAGLALLAGVAVAADQAAAPALINESPSLPKGAYIRMPDGRIARGAIVAIPQPVQARAYLASLGMPKTVLLLKRVAAVGGDPVCAQGASVATPHRQVWVAANDRRGVQLPAWRDCRVLEDDELFLLGDTPSSYDSRYFGPVSRSETTGVYRKVLTW